MCTQSWFRLSGRKLSFVLQEGVEILQNTCKRVRLLRRMIYLGRFDIWPVMHFTQFRAKNSLCLACLSHSRDSNCRSTDMTD